MKAKLYTNCSLVRVPIKAGVEEYDMPQNVEWADRKIDKLVVCAPAASCTDPIDGVTPVLTDSDVADLFFTLYDADNREIMHDVSAAQLMHRNNNALTVDAKLNLSLCKIYFTQAPAADGTLLLYVYYQTRTEDYFDLPKKSITVTFPLDADQEISFQEIINTYAHALPETIKGIICWYPENNPAWLTLRDYKLTYQMSNIHTELCRPDINGLSAYDTQAALFLTNDLDIDFDYSNIRNATGVANTQQITFLF